LAFLICTIALVVAVTAGVLLILPRPHRTLGGDELLITLLLVGMWIAAITFGHGLIGLGWIHSRDFDIISTLAGIVFLVLIYLAIQVASAGSRPRSRLAHIAFGTWLSVYGPRALSVHAVPSEWSHD
jgi:hypothetical protein